MASAITKAQYLDGVCASKREYPTVLVAMNAAWLLSFRYGHLMGAYCCEQCGKYHLTKTIDGDGVLAVAWVMGGAHARAA